MILMTDIWQDSKYIRGLPRQPEHGKSVRDQSSVSKKLMV